MFQFPFRWMQICSLHERIVEAFREQCIYDVDHSMVISKWWSTRKMKVISLGLEILLLSTINSSFKVSSDNLSTQFQPIDGDYSLS